MIADVWGGVTLGDYTAVTTALNKACDGKATWTLLRKDELMSADLEGKVKFSPPTEAILREKDMIVDFCGVLLCSLV